MALLNSQSEIKKIFVFYLGRDATKEEIAHWINKKNTRLKEQLSKSEERNKALSTLFINALIRDITPEEKTLFLDFSYKDIANIIYSSKERIDIIKEQYWKFIGRPPSPEELFFHIQSRSKITALQEALNTSNERVQAIQKTYQDTLGRNATQEEIDKHIKKMRSIDWIRIVELGGK